MSAGLRFFRGYEKLISQMPAKENKGEKVLCCWLLCVVFHSDAIVKWERHLSQMKKVVWVKMRSTDENRLVCFL